MNFHDLHLRLIGYLQECIRSGQLTERGLARITGVSQSHMHNVLKGKKLLSPQMADEILDRLHIDLADLLARNDTNHGSL